MKDIYSRIILKGGRNGKGKRFFGNRVHETDVFGMEEKAGGGCAIEVIANDGAMQAVGMGGMYTQLVGTAGKRVKGYACGGFGALQHFVACDSGLAMFVIDKLVGTIEQVHAKR